MWRFTVSYRIFNFPILGRVTEPSKATQYVRDGDVYELISIRRVHRSTMWAAPLVFASVALAVPIGMTSAWHSFAELLNRTIGSHF